MRSPVRPKASLLLWSRIALARLVSGVPLPVPGWRARPEGELVWLVPDESPDGFGAALMVLRRMLKMRPDLQVVVSAPEALGPQLPDGVLRIDPAGENLSNIRSALRHWQPDAVVLSGAQLPPTLIGETFEAGVPLLSIDMTLPEAALNPGFTQRRLMRAALSRLSRISVRDAASMALIGRLGADPAHVEVGGLMSEPPEPLRCSEAERASIAAQTRTRPVWLAASVPAAEFPAVIEAHARAQRHAHRMLLILAPERPEDADDLAETLTDQGWIVERRTVEGEPDGDAQIFLADDADEYGLWYRVAPVTWMGGTFGAETPSPRSPLEPAALGSAILHGPGTGPFAAEYARLDAARAARAVTDETALGDAVADLMAADKAAMLAHNAWAVTSGGAGAAEAVARMVLNYLDDSSEDPGDLTGGAV